MITQLFDLALLEKRKMHRILSFLSNNCLPRQKSLVVVVLESAALLKFPLLIVFVTLNAACATAPANHQEDSWFSQDKYAHFVLSGLTSGVIAKAAREDGQSKCDAALIGFSVTLSLGAAKESYDKRRKKTLYSFQDMTWNLMGSTLGSLAGSNCR